MALFGIEGVIRGTSIITLPALSQSADNAPRVEKLKDKGGFKEEIFTFTVPVGPGNNLQDQTFEWRSLGALKPTPGVPKVKRLVQAGKDEVLATWTEELNPIQQMALGYFQFTGAGLNAALGGYWTLMAVASGVRTAQVQWEVSAAADTMIKGAAKVALGVGGMGIGA